VFFFFEGNPMNKIEFTNAQVIGGGSWVKMRINGAVV